MGSRGATNQKLGILLLVLIALGLSIIAPAVQWHDIELIKEQAEEDLKMYDCRKVPNKSLMYRNWCSRTLEELQLPGAENQDFCTKYPGLYVQNIEKYAYESISLLDVVGVDDLKNITQEHIDDICAQKCLTMTQTENALPDSRMTST